MDNLDSKHEGRIRKQNRSTSKDAKYAEPSEKPSPLVISTFTTDGRKKKRKTTAPSGLKTETSTGKLKTTAQFYAKSRKQSSEVGSDELENDDYEEHIPYGGQMYGAYSEEMRNFCSRDRYIDSRSTIMDLYDEANEKAVAWVPPPPPPPPDPPNPHS